MLVKILIEYNQILFNKEASVYNYSRFDIIKNAKLFMLNDKVSHIIEKCDDVSNSTDIEIHLQSGTILYGESEVIDIENIGTGGKFIEVSCI
jgi:hypothetical protein